MTSERLERESACQASMEQTRLVTIWFSKDELCTRIEVEICIEYQLPSIANKNSLGGGLHAA